MNWISTDDEIPLCDEVVFIISDEGIFVAKLEITHTPDHSEYFTNWWPLCNCSYPMRNTTDAIYWMPLPLPPKD